jgi:hypothetical protein
MDELKKLLAGSVPLIASVIGTASPIAGVLFSTIAHMFGLSTTANPTDVCTAINADPDHDVKLRQLEVEHQEAILTEATQIRMGAYTREADITKATGKRDWIMGFLAIFIVVAFFALAIIAFCMTLDPQKSNLCYFLLGVFGSGGFSVVVGYYFGSSVSPNIRLPVPPLPKNVVLPPPAQTR